MLNLTSLHHVAVGVTDVRESERFATDFGLLTAARTPDAVFMRTSGPAAFSYVIEKANAPGLRAIAFTVAGEADLAQAVRDHGAVRVDTGAWPGSGQAVALQDPEGTKVLLLAGSTPAQKLYQARSHAVNTGTVKPRKGQPQMVHPPGPPQLMRMGHLGLVSRDFDSTVAWYESVLGLLPSDVMYMGARDHRVGAFHRLNLGQQWTDHHTIAFFRGDKTQLHHLSFEMHDMNEQYAAHRWMTSKGWEPIWGVGRHPLGSHVFDLWRDPNRFRFETFTDTDLLTADKPAALHDVTEQSIDLWADRSHEDYFAP